MKKSGMAADTEVSSVIALHGIFTGAFLGFIGDHHAGITFVPSIWKVGNLLLLSCFHNSLPSFLLTKNA